MNLSCSFSMRIIKGRVILIARTALTTWPQCYRCLSYFWRLIFMTISVLIARKVPRCAISSLKVISYLAQICDNWRDFHGSMVCLISTNSMPPMVSLNLHGRLQLVNYHIGITACTDIVVVKSKYMYVFVHKMSRTHFNIYVFVRPTCLVQWLRSFR